MYARKEFIAHFINKIKCLKGTYSLISNWLKNSLVV